MHHQSGDNDLLLLLKNVRVNFGTLTAVRDVSLEIRGGDLIGLIGPNGAGKTTLLRAAAGIQPLSRGTVHVLGQTMGPGQIDAVRHIGFTPDTPHVFDELTVRTFLRFIAKGYAITGSEIDERIDFWLEKVWLTEKADQKIKALSRGMRQRLAIARALLPNPHVVLLDEPAAGLDPAGRVQFRQLLCSLREQRKALIVSSHILSDMTEYCTHIAIMAGGALHQFGTVSQVAAASDGRRCRYSLTLAQPTAGLHQMLRDIPGVDNIQIDGQTITLQYASNSHEAAQLLKHLVNNHLPVASFTANRPSLEEAYLQTGIRQVE